MSSNLQTLQRRIQTPSPEGDGDTVAIGRNKENSNTDAQQSGWHHLLLWGGLFVGALLLLFQPLAKPIWTDESISIVWGERPLFDILLGRATSADALPLHPLLIHITHTLFGDNLAAFRVASALPSVIGLWFVYQLGRRFSDRVGLLALWLCALSPGLLLYDRMARYHGLTALLSTMSVWAGLRLLDSGKVRDAVIYGLITWLMLMSYFLSTFVVMAEVACLLLLWRHEAVCRGRWLLLGAVCAAGALFLPFLIHGVSTASNSDMTKVAVEDPEVGQGIGGFIRRFALPTYVYCVGETVYVWTWLASIPGVLAALGTYLLGARTLWRNRRLEIILPITCLLVIFLSALATSGKFGAGQTLGSMAKRVSFALPLFYVTQSIGIVSLLQSRLANYRKAGLGLAAILLLVSIYSVSNYWRGREFLNPNYTAPWQEVIATMDRVHPFGTDTFVFSRGELALDYYLKNTVNHDGRSAITPWADNNVWTPAHVERNLAEHSVHYIWLVGRDRGDRTAVDDFYRLNSYLSGRYRRIGTYGVMPRSASETYYFKKVMKRDAAPYYIWMNLYDTTQKPAGEGAGA